MALSRARLDTGLRARRGVAGRAAGACRRRLVWPLLLACFAGPALAQADAETAAPVAARTLAFDPARTEFGFEIRTRLGQRIVGVFPRYAGAVTLLPDGRHTVQLRLFTAQAEIPRRPRYSQWLRGEDFFDAARWPAIEYVSRPFAPEILHEGGLLDGTLIIRGIALPQALRVLPAACPRPGRDCDVVARGNVQRGRFGMDNWSFALSDRVTFVLRSRLLDPADAPTP